MGEYEINGLIIILVFVLLMKIAHEYKKRE